MKPLSFSCTVSPGRPITRFTNVPPSPHLSATPFGVLKTTMSPRDGIRSRDRCGTRARGRSSRRGSRDSRALRAVQRRLHRRRRDAVRVDDPLLEREHDQDRAGDGEDPVERDADAARQAGKEAGERIAAVPGGIPLGLGVVGEQVVPALVSVVAVIRPLPLPRRVVVVGPLPRRARGRPAARRLVALLRLVVVGPVAPEVAGLRLVLGPAARLLATGAALVLLVLVLVVELAAVIAPVVAHRTCSRRQASTRAWSPESSTSGTGQPRNSAGRV